MRVKLSAHMPTMEKLRKLLRSEDPVTCMQAVALARSLGADVVNELLADTKVVPCPTADLFPGPRPHARVVRYPKTLPVVVPGKKLRGPHALRVPMTLALAGTAESRTARKLRRTPELALLGWLQEGNRIPIDLSVLRGFELRSLLVFEATELLGVEVLEQLELESLRLSAVDAYDLSKLRLPNLKHLWLEAFELAPTTGTRFAPTALTGLRTLRLYSNPFMLDLAACARMPELRVLIARTAKLTRDLGPLAELTKLRELHLSYSPVTDLSPLPDSLEDLSLDSAKQLVDIAPLARLKKLRRLGLRRTKIDDWRPLLELPALEQLDVDKTAIESSLPAQLADKVRAWSRGSNRT